MQHLLRDARQLGELPDTLLVIEHDPVITTGRRTEPHEIAFALTTDVPVVDTERGGKATYHGPGQIVLYPIFDLQDHGGDVKRYVRMLEQSMIDALGALGLEGRRMPDYPGVWVDGRKIGSIGVRVAKWVSFHGLALNVTCDLAPFGWFTPCGIPDVEMTSIERELVARGLDTGTPYGDALFAAAQQQLVDSFVEVFQLDPRTVAADTLPGVAAPVAL